MPQRLTDHKAHLDRSMLLSISTLNLRCVIVYSWSESPAVPSKTQLEATPVESAEHATLIILFPGFEHALTILLRNHCIRVLILACIACIKEVRSQAEGLILAV